MALPLFVIYLLARSIHSFFRSSIEYGSKTSWLPSKTRVDTCIEDILKCGRATFECIILDSPSGNTKHTEIDELIISPYGIFCIEYKAHRGIIFGSFNRSVWTQCKFDGKRPIHNPLYQNYKHTRALEDLLGNNIKYPIVSYVVYTNATDVNVDSDQVFLGVNAMEVEISKQNIEIYSIDECRAILEILIPAIEHGRHLDQIHIQEVQEYLETLRV